MLQNNNAQITVIPFNQPQGVFGLEQPFVPLWLFKVTTMKHITLTQGQFAIVDDEDYEWLMTWKWYAHKGIYTYYAQSHINHGDIITMHRLLMLHPKNMQIDHKNHNGIDNRKSNLSICTARENQSNRQKAGSSQYTGVSWSKKRKQWQSLIRINKKQTHLGYFHSEFEAHLTYQNALKSITTPQR